MCKHMTIIFMLLPWLQAAVAKSNEPNAAELVRAVRKTEMWMYDFNSLYVRAERRWTNTPEEIAKRRREIIEEFNIDDPNEKRFPGLRRTSRDTLEYAVDRKRVRYLTYDPGYWRQLKIWDGNELRIHEKYYNYPQECYVLDGKIRNRAFHELFASNYGWPRSQPHSFWWDQRDVNASLDFYGQPDKFRLVGEQIYREIPCYVLEYNVPDKLSAGLAYRWFVGQADHLLYGIQTRRHDRLSVEHWTLNYRQVVPGGWFPMKTGWSIYDMDESGQSYLQTTFDLDVVEFQLNEPLSDDLFVLPIQPGVEVQDNRSGKLQIYKRWPSLLGKELPSFEGISISAPMPTKGKAILLCYIDLEQRPSRHAIRELIAQSELLMSHSIELILIQSSKMFPETLNEWREKLKIPFEIGAITGDSDTLRWSWGVHSLPWLILTDKKHTVQAEGFALNELEDNLKKFTNVDSTGLFIPDEMQELRETAAAVFQKTAGYHIEYKVDKHPLDEQYFPKSNIENALKAEDPDSPVLTSWIKGMRQSYSHDIALDVFDSCYLCRELKYALDDKQRLNLKHEGISSTDGDKNYAYWPQEKQGTIATDETGRMVPENPLTIYKTVTAILAEQDRFKLVSAVPASEEGQADTLASASWLAEFRDARVTEGYRLHQLLINHSPMRIIRDRVFSGSSKDQRWLQNETLFEDFAGYKLDSADIVLPRKIVKNSHLVRGTGLDNEPTVFAEKKFLYLKDLSPPKVTQKDSFAYCFPAGTEVWVKDQDYSYFARGDGKIVPLHPPSLLDKPLPELEELKIKLPTADTEDKMILVCFFDVNQRPSRNCIGQLAKKAAELKEKGVTIVAVQASEVSENKLAELKKKYNIPFQLGTIKEDIEKTRFTWGVKSLPWLILTDQRHTIRAESIAIPELDQNVGLITQTKEVKQ